MRQRGAPPLLTMLGLAVSMAVAAGVMLVAPAVAASQGQSADGAGSRASVTKGRFALGDSVMQGAKGNLRNRGFRVNTNKSRQVYEGVEVLRSQRSRGNLRKNVVVHLGTNGSFTASQCASMHRIVGAHRRLFVLTVKAPRSWTSSNNRVISRCARKFENTHLIDWRRFAINHRWATYSDGYHLTARGAAAYARLIDRSVSR